MSRDYILSSAVSPGNAIKLRNIALWGLQVATAAMLLMAGFFKLAATEQAIVMFEEIGVGQWFRHLTGVLEVSGAMLLLVPALAGVGALVLAAVMVGALLTEVLILGGSALMPLILLVVLGTIAYSRHDRTVDLYHRWAERGIGARATEA